MSFSWTQLFVGQVKGTTWPQGQAEAGNRSKIGRCGILQQSHTHLFFMSWAAIFGLGTHQKYTKKNGGCTLAAVVPTRCAGLGQRHALDAARDRS